jgi:hypothetical protein
MRPSRITAILCFAAVVITCVSCQTPPGEGWKARAGYRDAQPVITALEKFHADRRRYPADLQELIPAYLAHMPSRGFVYRGDGDSFWLQFSYTGPGMNHCSYDSQTRKWRARGYY